MKTNIDEIKVNVRIMEDKKTKAIITLDFGEVAIKGFRISESLHENEQGDKLWVQPPSYKGGGGYHPIFFMHNKDQWKLLENRILLEYKSQLDTQQKKKYGIKDDEW